MSIAIATLVAVSTGLLGWVLLHVLAGFVSQEVKPVVQSKEHQDMPRLRLPNVGGMALLVSLWLLTGLWWLAHQPGYQELAVLTTLTSAFFVLGLADDWLKWRRAVGVSERVYLLGHGILALLTVLVLLWVHPGLAQSDFQGGRVLQALNIGGTLGLVLTLTWLWALTYGTSFSVAVSDGIDGLTAGMASIAGAGMLASLLVREAAPGPVVFAAALLGASLGLLVLNQPSNWSSTGTVRRRARLYLGDSGALALGGAFAATALFSRADAVWLFIGWAFLLDGFSAFLQAKVITPFFRKFLVLSRYADAPSFVPHTEFPLPFTATPLHHHYEMLGIGRLRVAWLFYAFAALSAAVGTAVAAFPSLHVAPVGAALVLFSLMLGSATWTAGRFLGVEGADLVLCAGRPYRLASIPLYRVVERVRVPLPSQPEQRAALHLWQVRNRWDALADLAYAQFLAGDSAGAEATWQRIPQANRRLRADHPLAQALAKQRADVEVQTR